MTSLCASSSPLRLLLPLVAATVASLAMAGCASETETAESQGGAQDITSSEKGNVKDAITKILEVAPEGEYVGKTPAGEECTVSVLATSMSVPELSVLLKKPGIEFGFEVHPLIPRESANKKSEDEETPVSSLSQQKDGISFSVKFAGYGISYSTERNEANVTLSNFKKSGASLKATMNLPRLYFRDFPFECTDLVLDKSR